MAAGGADPALAKARSLVIGIGNPLRGDDGAGWTLADELGEPHRALHQLTPECAALLADCTRVLFVDACCPDSNNPDGPGSAATPVLEPLAPRGRGPSDATSPFSHHLTPDDLLTITHQLFGRRPEAWQLLLPVEVMGHSTAFSPALQASLPLARDLLRDWLREGR